MRIDPPFRRSTIIAAVLAALILAGLTAYVVHWVTPATDRSISREPGTGWLVLFGVAIVMLAGLAIIAYAGLHAFDARSWPSLLVVLPGLALLVLGTAIALLDFETWGPQGCID